MSTQAKDKAKNSAEKTKGKAKEVAGKVLGNRKLSAEGKGIQAKIDVKSAATKVLEVAGAVVGTAKGKIKETAEVARTKAEESKKAGKGTAKS